MTPEAKERNEEIGDLLGERMLHKLDDLEGQLCGHADTEAGFYVGILAAVEMVRSGAKAMLPNDDYPSLLAFLENFVDDMRPGKR